MRVLGVDFGLARIGIAVGEMDVELASPRPALKASGNLATDASAIAKIARDEEASLIALGIPEYAGSDRQAGICRRLGEQLEALGLQVRYVDEALTSIEADARLREHEWTAAKRKRHRDGEAACLILERLFQQDL